MEVIIKARKPQYSTIKCSGCNALLEFELPTGATTGTPKYKVQCYNTLCEKLVPFDPTKPPTPTHHNESARPGSSRAGASGFSFNSTNGAAAKSFKIGSDEEPASMEYYELLGVTHKADTAEIKKAYYRLAMKYHPDKNKTPEAEEMFKKISEAYQVLSDPVLRKKYNEFGPKGADPEGGFINPEDFFKMQFGGELFVDIIGELQIAKEFKNMMMKNGEGDEDKEEKEEDYATTLEKRREEMEARKKAREERVAILSENLKKKLNVYLEQGADHFKKFIGDEAEELKVQSYGVQLLHSIGYIYSVKASEYISKYTVDILSTPSFIHRMRLKGRTISETFSTVKSAVDVHHTFVQLQEAEKTGCTEAEREKLTEEAVKKGTDAIWKTSKLEVESVIRSVCDKTLADPSADRDTLRKRSEALKIVGDIYQSVTLPHMPYNHMF